MSQHLPQNDAVFALAPAAPPPGAETPFFAACGSGLFRSADRGRTWTHAYHNLALSEPLPTFTVALSPSFDQDRTLFAGVAGGVMRSYDGGATWIATRLPDPAPSVVAIAFSPDFRQDGHVFAATLQDGVFLSTNKGRDWAVWNFGLLDYHVLALAASPGFAADHTLFAGTESGIFYSQTRGKSWQEAALEAPAATPVLSLALSPGMPGNGLLYAGTEGHGLYRSRDKGRTWQAVAGTAGTAVNEIVLGASYPAAPELLILQPDGLCISRDDGRGWARQGLEELGGATAVLAPDGLAAGQPLLLGTTARGIQPAVSPA